MKKLIILLALIPFSLTAQVFEQFTDGDFKYNPEWVGDTSEFVISNSTTIPASLRPSLRLNAPSGTTGNSYIAVSNTMSIADSAEWKFWVKLPNPSANNNGRVYVVSDQQDMEGSLNGYYVGIGESGDRLTFGKQTGTTSSVLITGTVANLNYSSNVLRIRVKKSFTGDWSLYSDTLGGTNYSLEGTANDNSITTTSWFGMSCKYTSSNVTSWFFDDIYAGVVIIDSVAPYVTSVSAISPIQIDVKFSEAVDTNSAKTVGNYVVDNSVGNPTLALVDAVDASLVHLVFGISFSPSVLYNIQVCNVKDLAGNSMACETEQFAFYTPQAFDILINEIMSDPDPQVQLPAVEYVELYNRSSFPITLTGWKFYYGSSFKTLPAYTMPAGSYLTLSYGNDLDAYGNNLALFTSSSTLTNSGTTLMLTNSTGQIIHKVDYSSSWYTDNSKSSGGWSLELVDPLNPCAESANWKASVDPKGGTPGTVNSVNASNPDLTRPELLRAGVNPFYNDQVIVYFSEPLDSASLINRFKYQISNSIGNPSQVIPHGPDYTSATIILPAPYVITYGVTYTLTVIDSITDCAGNFIAINSSALFAIPDTASYNDIIINEVLYEPTSDCEDYVELYNNSDKIIDLGSMLLSTSDITEEAESISDEIYLMFPGDYYCITSDPVAVKSHYNTTNPKGFIPMPSMPSMNNTDGNIIIANKSNTIIDQFTYNSSMQLPLLTSTKGVSLERMSFDNPTQDASNWHSASESVGFGTPAYKNSQYSEFEASDDPISVNPEIFSPDNDGNNDVLKISYSFEETGYVANIIIYDSRGRQVKYLAKNFTLGNEGGFTWDGIDDNNEKATIGIYIIYAEVFDLQGNTKHYKKSAVLAGKIEN